MLILSMQMYAWDWWPLPMAEPDTCKDSLLYVGGVSMVSSSGQTAPTWLQANRNGAISSMPHSGNISLGIVKPATRPNRWYDYDGAVVITGQIAGTSLSAQPYQIKGTGFFEQLYAHVRLYIVDITAGIKPMDIGLGDKELSSGSLLISNNAHPFPRISVGLDRWTPIPGLFGYLELKGGLTYGWLADNNEYVSKTKFHHKFIGMRGGGKLPVNLSYEFHHAAEWGGYYGGLDLGNDFSSFTNVLFGRSGGATENDQLNKQGNHILSQQFCLTVKGEGWHVDAYWQDIQEDGGLNFIGCRANSVDGLWGVSAQQNIWPFISGLTFEVLQTTDQSGPWHDKDGIVMGGADNYYANLTYKQGWTYFGRTLGSPLISPDNNRVWAYHIGIKGDIYGYKYRALCTYADNYGTYKMPQKSHNTALLLEVSKHVPQAWGMDFKISLAGDFGTQYGNQFGAMITISKQGIIKNW